ncbi:hypothetical protein [Serratia marcescens]|uniref:hypothetical protein n=1 Tax=Serratia marcescens TaxID=615 RepID=UPI0021BB0BF7|nr:hypothetical protein [Serratia marcescens]
MSLKTNMLTGRHKMPALMDAKSPHIAARACLLVSLREARTSCGGNHPHKLQTKKNLL